MTHAGPGIKDGTAFIVRCAFAVLHGATAKEAIMKALEEGVGDIDLDLRLRQAVDSVDRDSLAVIKEFGQMCAINAALPAAVHLMLRHETDLRQALIENVMAGGDSAARGMVVGMILGAAAGPAAIPAEWLEELTALPQIQNCLSRLP
jgi:ADP-ribosylglycohydrolase